jgi:translation elongation factor EF-Tu-like GTPase
VDAIEQETILPGGQGAVELTLMHPERFGAALRAGGSFEIREGARVVGWGVIERIGSPVE